MLEADNGITALALVKSRRVNLVLSDIRMPGGDGITLLEQLRATVPDFPAVIFMTGFADISETECIARGAKRVIAKPFNRQLMMESALDTLGLAKAPPERTQVVSGDGANERKFIHDVAGPLGIAMLLLEGIADELRLSDGLPPRTRTDLGQAAHELERIKEMLMARRQLLIALGVPSVRPATPSSCVALDTAHKA